MRLPPEVIEAWARTRRAPDERARLALQRISWNIMRAEAAQLTGDRVAATLAEGRPILILRGRGIRIRPPRSQGRPKNGQT